MSGSTQNTNLLVKHKNQVRQIALYNGLAAEELSSILQAIFGLSANLHVVGLLSAESGLVIPISLACRSPESLSTGSEYTLLVGSDEGNSELPVPPTRNSNKPNTQTSANVAPPPAPQEKQMIADDEQTEYAMSEIIRFIAGLRIRQILNKHEAQSLEDLLFENGTLLYAAYSVAVSASDAEYLAEICRDLAQSLQTEAGRTACEAQDEVLQVCDQLYLAHKITENQLLYLRHLVLIREEAVASIYDDFQVGYVNNNFSL